ncbi:MAG: Y-family DNA polymerase [Porticoccaceae bacterium]|nr:Y-family DNA polymerase [Porticoccaceae bacterium]
MIGLCDMRSFYCSCEKVFRPDIRDRGVVVTSNNDGVVVALDNQAKAAGIKKFEPYFKQRQLIERAGVLAFSSNYELYGEVSGRIMTTLAELAPGDIEVYSIDECFVDFSTVPRTELKAFAAMLRDTIWQQQGIKMGVSIAPSKTLAKLGQCAAKQYPQLEGVCVLERAEQWQWLAARVDVSEVWGIGRKLTGKLKARGLATAADLSAMAKADARALQGITLVRTVRELQGETCIDIDCQPQPKQNIISSRSFGQKQTRLEPLQEAVSHYAVRAGAKLRAQSSLCFRLSAWIQTSAHDATPYANELAVSLPGGTADSRQLSRAAVALVAQLYRPGYRYAKAGVALHDIRPERLAQLDLLAPRSENSVCLMKVVDGVNRRFGSGAIKLARQGGDNGFAMRRAMKSPSYLSRWREIPRIKLA